MKGKIIFSTARHFMSKAAKTVGRNSPTIMIVAGSVGVVAGVVLAIKAGKESDAKTVKEKEDLKTVLEHKDKISDEPIELENGDTVVYNKEAYAKDLARAYGRLIFAYIKVYGPAVFTTAFSLFLILTSHRVLHGRYTTTCAGFAAMSKAYETYRQNVIDEEGPEADLRYRLGIKTVEEEKPLIDKEGNPKLDKNGNPKMIREKYDILKNVDLSDPRTVLWDEVTTGKTTIYDNTSMDDLERSINNNAKINAAEMAANHTLKVRAMDPLNDGIGYIYLNEVRHQLGVEPIDVGNLLGWRYDPRFDISSPKFDQKYYDKYFDSWGDNCVDFGLNNPKIPGYEDRLRFLTGKEDAVLLYMNYDGEIWDKTVKHAPLKRRR